MAGGTYTLVLERATDGRIDVGALGPRGFPAGWYAYAGSALGPGGFARVERHERVAAGDHDARHWHVDYLLGADGTAVDHVLRSAGVDAECAVARRIDRQIGRGQSDGDGPTADVRAGDPARVDGFGCSDCACPSHLAFHPDRAALLDAVDRAHRAVRADEAPADRPDGDA